MLTILLLIVYYSSPNNYFINTFDKTKFNLVKEYNEKIIPWTNIIIPIIDTNKYFIKFDKVDETNVLVENFNTPIIKSSNMQLLIKNSFKSQNIILEEDKLIQTRYGSNLTLLNQTPNETNIKISFYNQI